MKAGSRFAVVGGRSGKGRSRVIRAARNRRLWISAPLIATAFLLAMALGSTATQADLYPLTTFGTFTAPAGVAVKQSTGNVYVVDRGSNDVQAFDSAGAFLFSFGKGVNATTSGNLCTAASGDECQGGTAGSSNGAFDGPQGVAVDQATGAVYVVDAGNRRIQKFDEAGNFLLKFGSPGSGNGEFSAWSDGSFIAVDSSGGVYVGDGAANPRIEKFDPSGAFVEELTGINSFGGVHALAVDGVGSIYDGDGQVTVHKLDATGTLEHDLGAPAPQALAVDPLTNDVYVGDSSGYQIFQYDSSGNQVGNPFGAGVIGDSRGIAYDASRAVLYVADSGCGCVRVFGTPPVTAPQIESTSTADQTTTSATLQAQINPSGAETTYYFEWGTDQTYGNVQPAPPAAIGSGFTPQQVAESISGLDPKATYHYRVVAVNSQGTTVGDDQTMAPLPSPSIVETSVSEVRTTQAQLHASINPNGVATEYRFEWGASDSYGNSVPSPDAAIGSGGEPVAVTQSLAGLQPNTEYHFRIVAVSATGTTLGEDRTFRTQAAASNFELPDNRAYELVSPVQKGGNDIAANPWRTRSSTDGDAVAYISHGAFADARGTSVGVDYIARRTAQGWITHALTPDQPANFPLPGPMNQTRYVGDMSPDLSKGILFARTPLTDAPNVAIANNLYLRDNLLDGVAPNPGDGAHYQLLSDAVEPVTEDESGFNASHIPWVYPADQSRDLNHVLIESRHRLTADGQAGAPHVYVAHSNGIVELAGILPNGQAAATSYPGSGVGPGENGEGNASRVNPNAISDDGSRVVFSAPPPLRAPGEPGYLVEGGALYLREDGAITVKINQSERTTTPDPNGERWADYMGASADGSKVLFIPTEPLTNDDNNTGVDPKFGDHFAYPDLYMYDVNAPAGHHLTLISKDTCGCIGPQKGGRPAYGVLGLSDDGRYIYFAGSGLLGEPTQNNPESIYVWHDGSLRFVGYAAAEPARGQRTPTWIPFGRTQFEGTSSRVTPDGQAVAFITSVSNPPYNLKSKSELCGPEGCNEVFVYDYRSDKLVCASCNPTGAELIGYADFQTEQDADLTGFGENFHKNHALSDDGRFVFFDSPDPLVPEDTNGRRDAYEYDLSRGQVHLLSSGQCNCDSAFVEADADGSTVFIQTRQQLVRVDQDKNADLYAVKVDGGIPSQNQVPPSGCEGDACQAAAIPPNDPTPASTTFSGPGSSAKKLHRRHKRHRRHHSRHHRKQRHVRHGKVRNG